MTDALNYVLQRIECDYFSENYDVLVGRNVTCLRREGLPCNCITGAVVNYAAFLTSACMSENTYVANMDSIEDTEGECCIYIRCTEDSCAVCPVMFPFDEHEVYCVGNLLCTDSDGLSAYIKFHPISYFDRIKDDIEEFIKNHMLSPESALELEYWVQFLAAMRIKPLEITWKAFLSMAIYYYPSRTLDLIWKSKDSLKKESLVRFFGDYLCFLSSINGSSELGFQHRFVVAFKKLAAIDISPFVEHISHCDHSKENIPMKTMISGYHRNVQEIIRRRGFLRRFCLEYLDNEDLQITFRNLENTFKQNSIPQVEWNC